MGKRRMFSREFKLSVLSELQNKPAAEACRQNGISQSVVHKWKEEYEADPEKAFSGNGNLWKAEAEAESYKRLVGELYVENAFLKKTIRNLQKLSEKEAKLKSIK